ncbi:DUF3048 domain-containing protein [Candidatus Peregrinibacteria bacterium]|nr:DUF3048 domain-containing protein [Candidatus Peregrinibacteria bacterium]
MNFKELLQRLRQKAKFEPKFIGVLALVAVGAFVIIELILGAIMHSVEKNRYDIQPLDERVIYGIAPHNVKDDFPLLLEKQPSILNGAPIEQDIGKGQVLAVVIENYTPIRSTQIGLEEAAIVYEVPTEGGITRLLALYDGRPIEAMGPVRSARPYFITWASEYRAAFVHVGGSPEALANLIGNFRLFNIDEFADYVTIWRNNQYLAPHNAFTSTENIYERLNKENYYQPVKTKRFPFKDPDDVSGDIRTITIDFSIAPYAVKYAYDETNHTYTRYNGGKTHHNIQPANVVIQFVDTEVLDDIGRLRIQTHGTGKTLVFRDGHVVEGTWEKDASINSPDQPIDQSWTKFFDQNGDEIELNRGQVWIEVVPNGRSVNYF